MIKVLFSKNEARIKKQLLLIRKFLGIELDKPIAVVDMISAKLENSKDLKSRILDEYRKAKKGVLTAESGSLLQKKNLEKKKEQDDLNSTQASASGKTKED